MRRSLFSVRSLLGMLFILVLTISCDILENIGFSAPSEHSPSRYRVEGRITYKVFGNESVEYQATNSFSLAVSGCRWIIRTTPLNKRPTTTLDYTEMSGDGQQIKMLYSFSKITNGVPTNSLIAKLEKNNVPIDDGSMISYLWLAYASACYFRSITNDQLKPVWMLDDEDLRPEGFTVHAAWGLLDVSAWIPERIDYFNDGIFRSRSSKISKKRLKFEAPPPYNLGYTNAIYRVLVATNYSNVNLPESFLFLRFAINSGGKTNTDLRVINVVEARAFEFANLEDGVTLDPSYSGTTHVIDRRFFPPIPVVEYKTRNGQWLEEKRVQQIPEYEKKRRAYTSALETGGDARKKTLMMVFFGIIFLSLPIIFYWRSLQKKPE